MTRWIRLWRNASASVDGDTSAIDTLKTTRACEPNRGAGLWVGTVTSISGARSRSRELIGLLSHG